MPLEHFRGYRGNVNIKGPNVNIEWTPDLIEEFIKCQDDPIYFMLNHMKIISKDEGLIPFELFPYQKEMVRSMQKNRYSIFTTARQAGKALTLDTDIPTPNGWKKMGDLKVGDKVFTKIGKETTINAISPIFINHDCYEITFDDNTKIKADANHKWVVIDKLHRKKKIEVSKTTEELYKSKCVWTDRRGKVNSKWAIENCQPIEYPSKDVKIDPYLLGVWLGDGESASGRITCLNDDLVEYKTVIGQDFSPSHNHSLRPNIYTGTIYGLSSTLKQYGLIKNKHIPQDYLQNNLETRLAILQGLMDTDGYTCRKRSGITLSYNRYPQLIEDIHELLLSFGLKVFRKRNEKKQAVTLSFCCPKDKLKLYRLSRKLARQPEKNERFSYVNSRFIRKIEKIKSVPTKCISVNDESHLFLAGKEFIPTHNSTVVCGFILWYIIFHEFKSVALLADKAETAREILTKVSLAYEHLPKWLQQGVRSQNKSSIYLENGSRVFAAATTSKAIRGYSTNLLFIDEAAHIENWDDFFTATYPTISSGKTTQIVLVSTPYGLNHFHKTWQLAHRPHNDGWNGYNPIEVKWNDVPGRDEKWKEEYLQGINFDYEKFAQEMECEFLGSSGSLISGKKLKELVYQTPIMEKDGLCQYAKPIRDHRYALVADVARGRGIDYSAFSIIDITEMPFSQAAVYRNNLILPVDYGEIIHNMAKMYNDALVLIETNDIGEQICDILYYEYEYINVVQTENIGNQGKKISQGFSGRKTDRGVRTTTRVKNIGCSILKMLVEQDQLIINDVYTIAELATFSKKNKSYEAEPGKHDDIVMGLVLFSWMSDQTFFKEYAGVNTLNQLRERTDEEIFAELTPFGLIDDGSPDEINFEGEYVLPEDTEFGF